MFDASILTECNYIHVRRTKLTKRRHNYVCGQVFFLLNPAVKVPQMKPGYCLLQLAIKE